MNCPVPHTNLKHFLTHTRAEQGSQRLRGQCKDILAAFFVTVPVAKKLLVVLLVHG